MTDLFDNPLGLDGFEFLEFSAPEKGVLEECFAGMGFTLVARHRSKDVQLWRQGAINFIANYEPKSPAAYFAAEHGPSACGMGFRVRDAGKAYAEALARGAEPANVNTGPMELNIPAIRGIGHSLIYLIDRYEDGENEALSIYDIDFVWEKGVDRHPEGAGLRIIDHLTHNVYGGRMSHWAAVLRAHLQFPRDPLFRHQGRIHRPDQQGDDCARRQDPNSAQRGRPERRRTDRGIPPRVQRRRHPAHRHELRQPLRGWDRLKACGTPFAPAPPDTYYEMLEDRLPGHGEPVEELRKRGILLDGSTEDGDPRLLLQIFSQTMIGPVFFEFIQRKKDEGFGEGNFTALFKSMEADQVRRGKLQAQDAEFRRLSCLPCVQRAASHLREKGRAVRSATTRGSSLA